MDEKELREFLIRQDAELKALMSKPHPELSARLLQVEQRLASPSPSGGSRMCLGVGDDIGLALTSSEGFKAVTKGANRSGQITVGSFHKAIVNASGQNQPLVPDMRVPGVIPPGMYPLTVRDILSQFRTSSNLVQYTRELSFTNAAAPQAGENVAKAESQMTFELKNAPVQTLAHWIAASRQVLTDRTTQSSDRFEVRAGHATRRHRVVKSFGADDLVFQSVWKGRPMLDGNILKRFIHPAAKKLGIYVNWLCLRTSYATWLVYAGADPKSVQGQMRHSRISTTMDIYAQIVPAGQRRAVDKLSEYVNEASESAVRKPVPLLFQ